MTKLQLERIAARAAHENCACVPEGWKLVPVEPTEKMVEAAVVRRPDFSDINAGRKSYPNVETRQAYRAMLAAAPAAPTEGALDASAQQDEREAFEACGLTPTNAHRKAFHLGYKAASRDRVFCGDVMDAVKDELSEFSQQDDFMLAHGASIMSEHSHEIIHIDTVRRIARAAQQVQADAAVGMTDEDILELWTGDPTHSRPVMGKNKVLAFARAILAKVQAAKEQAA